MVKQWYYNVILYYNIIILWDHSHICGPSLTETSLCVAYLYSIPCSVNASFPAVEAAQASTPYYKTKPYGAVGNTSLCLGVGGLKYRYVNCRFWPRFFIRFPRFVQVNPGLMIEIRSMSLSSHTYQLILNYPSIRDSIIWAFDIFLK